MMTYQIRRYQQHDIEKCIEILRDEHLKLGNMSDKGFSKTLMLDMLMGNLRNLNFFLNLATTKDDELVGCFCGQISKFFFSSEMIAIDHLFFIREEHRSIELATKLVASYVDWAKERKVRRAMLRNVTGVAVDKFAKLAERLDFKQIGTNHAMEF